MEEQKVTMKNLISKQTDTNTIVAVENREKFINISYNKKESFFMNSMDFVKFIKTVEAMIRHSREYSSYIAYLKTEIGLKQCVIFGNINDDIAKIEMHHGPIFTLYDYVEITLTHLFKKGEPINSCNVAYNVLKDHFDNNIQVVMLCEAAHQAVHKSKGDSKFFVSTDSAWGNIVEYLHKYSDGINLTHIQKIKKYLIDYDRYKTTEDKMSNHVSIFNEYIKSFNNSYQSNK
jgi:hypothetical protein